MSEIGKQIAQLMVLEDTLILLAKHDERNQLFWDPELNLSINCSDVFYWACADAEPIETIEDVENLRRAYAEADALGSEQWGAALYAARRRGMRPQDPAIPSGPIGDLFRACGPERTKASQG